MYIIIREILSPKITPLDSNEKTFEMKSIKALTNNYFDFTKQYHSVKVTNRKYLSTISLQYISARTELYDIVEYLPPKRELNRSFLEMSDIDPLLMGVMKLDSLGWTSYLHVQTKFCDTIDAQMPSSSTRPTPPLG